MALRIFFFLLSRMACRILVPQLGTEATVNARSPNHWTAREFPVNIFKIFLY